MASPAFVGVGTFNNNISVTGSVSRPTVSEGDVMLLVVGVPYSDADVTPPSGWTLVDQADPENVFSAGVDVYYKVAGASEDASYTVGVGGQGGGNNLCSGVILAWGPVGATPIDVVAKTVSAASSTSIVSPTVTTTEADTTLVCVVINTGLQNNTYTAPGSMTERFDNRGAGGEAMAVFDEAIASSGATGTRTATASTAVGYHAITIALAPAGDGPPPSSIAPISAYHSMMRNT